MKEPSVQRLPTPKDPSTPSSKASEGGYAVDRYIAEQDQYQRFLVTGHNSTEIGRQDIYKGSQGAPLQLPYQQRGKVPALSCSILV